MTWDVEYTDDFGSWWKTLSESEQEDVAAVVTLLEERGTQLPFPRTPVPRRQKNLGQGAGTS